MAGGEDILQKMQREAFVKQHGERQHLSLLGREFVFRKAGRLLHGAQVILPPDSQRVDFRPGTECQLEVFLRRNISARAGDHKVGIVGLCPGCIVAIGTLQPNVGGTQRIDPSGPRGLALHPPLKIKDRALIAWDLAGGRKDVDA